MSKQTIPPQTGFVAALLATIKAAPAKERAHSPRRLMLHGVMAAKNGPSGLRENGRVVVSQCDLLRCIPYLHRVATLAASRNEKARPLCRASRFQKPILSMASFSTDSG